MARWHYRILTSSFDPQAYRAVVHDAYQEGEAKAKALRSVFPRSRDSGTDEAAVAAVAGIVSAPRKVEAKDGEAEHAELLELIAARTVKATDLVRQEGQTSWVTAAEHPELYELFEEHEGATGGRTTRYVFIGIAVLSVVAAVGLLIRG